jgi:hypothetical protein
MKFYTRITSKKLDNKFSSSFYRLSLIRRVLSKVKNSIKASASSYEGNEGKKKDSRCLMQVELTQEEMNFINEDIPDVSRVDQIVIAIECLEDLQTVQFSTTDGILDDKYGEVSIVKGLTIYTFNYNPKSPGWDAVKFVENFPRLPVYVVIEVHTYPVERVFEITSGFRVTIEETEEILESIIPIKSPVIPGNWYNN